jgi:hypothetical protein
LNSRQDRQWSALCRRQSSAHLQFYFESRERPGLMEFKFLLRIRYGTADWRRVPRIAHHDRT